MMVEATAVSPEGRISPQDSGIWTDQHAVAFARITKFIKEQGAVSALSWHAVSDLVKKAGATVRWDGMQGASEARWEQHGVFEYAWIEDATALAPKLALQKRYGLRGISVWRIGHEDPGVWTQFPPE